MSSNPKNFLPATTSLSYCYPPQQPGEAYKNHLAPAMPECLVTLPIAFHLSHIDRLLNVARENKNKQMQAEHLREAAVVQLVDLWLSRIFSEGGRYD